LKILS